MAFGTFQERLALLITADAAGAVREIQKVGDEADKSLGRAQSRADKWAAGLARGGAAAVGFAAVSGAALWKLGQSAGELEQQIGATEAVFGDSADTISSWAKTAAASAGLSEQAARRFTSQIGAMLQGYGLDAEAAARKSIELTQLGADLAATFGGTVEEAITAVGAALRGERDPIERYGVAFKQTDVNARIAALGLDTTTTAARKNAEITATLSLIYDSTAKAQGQFARESDTLAGKQAILAADFQNLRDNIGMGVLPVLNTLVGAASDVTGVFNDLDPATQKAIGSIAAIGTIGVGAAGGLALITAGAIKTAQQLQVLKGGFDAFRAGLQGIETGFGSAFGNRVGIAINNMGGLGNVSLRAAAAIGVVGLAIHQFGANAERAARQQREFAKALIEGGKAAEGAKDQFVELFRELDIHGEVSDEFTGSMRDQIQAFRDLTLAGKDTKQVKEEIVAATRREAEAQGLAADRVKALQVRVEDYLKAVEKEAETLGAATVQTEQARRAQQEYADLLASGTASEEELEAARKRVIETTKAQKTTQNAVTAAINAGTDAVEDNAEATEFVEDAQKAYNERLEEGEKLHRDYTDAVFGTRDAARALDEANLDLAQKIAALNELTKHGKVFSAEYAQAERDAKAAIDDVAKAALESAQQQAILAGKHLSARQEADIQKLALAQLAARMAPGSELRVYIEQLIRDLDNFARPRRASLEVAVRTSGRTTGDLFGTPQRRQHGGPVPGGKHDEVPILAHGGEFVLDADTVEAIKHGQPTRGTARRGTPSAAGDEGTTILNNYTLHVHLPSYLGSEREAAERLARPILDQLISLQHRGEPISITR